MEDYYYLVLDTVSIQNYIFSSNKLAENMGASYIVKNLFKEVINEFNYINQETWESDQFDKLKIMANKDVEAEILYIGGGKVVLVFRDNDKAKTFIEEASEFVLTKFQGIEVSYGICKAPPSLDQKLPPELFISLMRNKSRSKQKNTFLGFGITAECSRSGLPAEEKIKDNDGNIEWISLVAKKKIDAQEDAKKDFNKNLIEVNGYNIGTDLEHIGQVTGESRIAIIHIDGNRIGKRIQKLPVKELREFSKKISETTKVAFKSVIDFLIENYSFFSKDNNYNLKNGNLPIIPLIIGGDDVTFVCDARLAISISKIYMDAFSKKSKEIIGEELSSSAGIAIVKTKFPFFKAYQLAEQVCDKAKIIAHQDLMDKTSVLDFVMMKESFAGSYEDILKDYFTCKNGQLHFGPYVLIDNEPNGIDNFFKSLKYFKNNISKSKLKELYSLLFNPLSEIETKLKHFEYREIKFGNISNEYTKLLWKDEKTPFADIISMTDFSDLIDK